jgi:hypothetical protein
MILWNERGSGLLGSTKLVLRHDDAEEMLAGAIRSQHPATTLPLVTASLAAGLLDGQEQRELPGDHARARLRDACKNR